MTIESPYAALLSAIPVERREVEILGSVTRYWAYGPDDAAVTIAIAHGFRGEHHGIEPIIAQLPGIRFISPDLPGFGESSPMVSTPHSIDGYASWFTAFLDELGLTGRAIVLGHSFGSIFTSAAVAAGLTTPALILVNPIATAGLTGVRRAAMTVTRGYYAFAGWLPEQLGLRVLDNWPIVQLMSVGMAKTKQKPLRRWIHDQHHTYFSRFANKDLAVEGFRASVSADVTAYAAAIHVPTLLIAARLDDITPIEATHQLAGLFPNCTLRVLEGVGHLIHYEVPDQAAVAVTEFLADLATPLPPRPIDETH